MFLQFRYFIQDVNRILGKYKIRILFIWMSRSFWGAFIYRWERGWYLLFGNSYSVIRIIFLPIISLIQFYSNMDIHYQADIGPGLKVLHPAMGIVISGLSRIGNNLTLIGGNVIGAKSGCLPWGIVIGDQCTLGANAVVVGPVKIANNVEIGALACVVKDCLEEGAILVGVPAHSIKHR
jgi:serine O-acetyltransferase